MIILYPDHPSLGLVCRTINFNNNFGHEFAAEEIGTV